MKPELSVDEQINVINRSTGLVSESITLGNSNNYSGVIFLASDDYCSTIKINGRKGLGSSKAYHHGSIEKLITEARQQENFLGVAPVSDSVMEFIESNYRGEFVVCEGAKISPELVDGIIWYCFNQLTSLPK